MKYNFIVFLLIAILINPYDLIVDAKKKKNKKTKNDKKLRVGSPIRPKHVPTERHCYSCMAIANTVEPILKKIKSEDREEMVS